MENWVFDVELAIVLIACSIGIYGLYIIRRVMKQIVQSTLQNEWSTTDSNFNSEFSAASISIKKNQKNESKKKERIFSRKYIDLNTYMF